MTSTAKNLNMSIEPQTIREFLRVLDGSARWFHFLAIPERADLQEHNNKVRTLCCSTDAALVKLQPLAENGYGIFVAFNSFKDHCPRKIEHLNYIRGCFIEDDGNFQWEKLGKHKPTLLVETSRRKYHGYLLTMPGEIKEELYFTAYMQRLIEWGSDKNAKDITRVLRIPGTINWKYDIPWQVRIVKNIKRQSEKQGVENDVFK